MEDAEGTDCHFRLPGGGQSAEYDQHHVDCAECAEFRGDCDYRGAAAGAA